MNYFIKSTESYNFEAYFKIGAERTAKISYSLIEISGECFIAGAAYSSYTWDDDCKWELNGSMCRPIEDFDGSVFGEKSSETFNFCKALLRKAYANKKERERERHNNINIYGRKIVNVNNPKQFRRLGKEYIYEPSGSWIPKPRGPIGGGNRGTPKPKGETLPKVRQYPERGGTGSNPV